MISTYRPPPNKTMRRVALKEKLSNKQWRMRNLYRILNKEKLVVRFDPNDEQVIFFAGRHTQNLVVKCRKRGISTGIVLDYLDDCIWAPKDRPVHAAHVDMRDIDAKEKLSWARQAITWGLEDPDPFVAGIWKKRMEQNPLVVDNKGELMWANGSKQQASTSFMGGNPSRLHISEFGPLSAKYPLRADEIMRGTLNSAAAMTLIDIETTMEGGSLGECGKLMEQATDKPETRLDWKRFFISWLTDPECDLPGEVPELDYTKRYFARLKITDDLDVPLSRQAWYEKKWIVQRGRMFTQFPTVIAECLHTGYGKPYFDADSLQWMKEKITPLQAGGNILYGEVVIQGDVKNYDARSAVFRVRDPKVAWIRVLEYPEPGRHYSIFADCCVGKQAEGSDDAKRDAHSYGVIRDEYVDEAGSLHLKQIIAMCLPNDQCPTTEFIRRIVALSIYYGDCQVVPEINNKDDIAPRLIAAGVRNMYRQGRVGADDAPPGTKRTEEVFGWLTRGGGEHGAGGTRKQMLDHMLEETLQCRWICTFPEVLHQMGTFILNHHGRSEAAPGEHDDHVMGPGIGLFTIGGATKFKGKEQVVRDRWVSAWNEEHFDPTGL